MSALSSAASKRAEELTQLHSHTRPDGRHCSTIFEEYGITSPAGSEIIYTCSGDITPETALRVWMNSTNNKAAILDPIYDFVGIGVAVDDRGNIHWVQLFAR